MTGERTSFFAQPGGRPPAPGALALVQAFLNTHYDLDGDRGAEVWATAPAYARWLREHGLLGDDAPVHDRELHRALRVRDALRACAQGDVAALEVLSDAGRGAPVEVRFAPGAPPEFASDGAAASAVGLVLAHAAQAMRDGTWQRLKICPGRDCGWAFYDHSRNGSGRWCSMSICGGREKARAHYERGRGRAPRGR